MPTRLNLTGLGLCRRNPEALTEVKDENRQGYQQDRGNFINHRPITDRQFAPKMLFGVTQTT